MIGEITKQQYYIDYINSEIEDIPNKIKEIFMLEKATVILKQRDKIILGKYQDGLVKFNQNIDITLKEFFLEIRVFNKNREVYFWNTSKGIRGRYIADEGKDLTHVFEEELMLWGKVSEINDEYIVLTEEKIKDLEIPIINGISKNDSVFIRIKNYIFKNENDEDNDGVPFIKFWRAVEITK